MLDKLRRMELFGPVVRADFRHSRGLFRLISKHAWCTSSKDSLAFMGKDDLRSPKRCSLPCAERVGDPRYP